MSRYLKGCHSVIQVSLVKSISTSDNVLKFKNITVLEKLNAKEPHKISVEPLYFIGSLIDITFIAPNLFSQPLCTRNTFWVNVND